MVDPLFHRDIGFFVFSLPLYRKVAEWLLVTGALALGTAVLGHVATGAIRHEAAAHLRDPARSCSRAGAGRRPARQPRVQSLARPVRPRAPRRGRTLPGAGYTAVNVLLPWLRALVVVALGGASMLVVAAARRSWALPAVALVLVAFAGLANPAILRRSSSASSSTLRPCRASAPIAHSIRFTQLAYGLDHVADRPLPANATDLRRATCGRTGTCSGTSSSGTPTS